MDGVRVTWVEDLAAWLLDARRAQVRGEVLHAAARQTLDALACAAGALGHEAAGPVRDVVDLVGGSPQAALWFGNTRSSLPNAVLHNGTLVRALDCNDVFFDYGPMSHPSDNLAAILACAELAWSSGREYLHAVALGYELEWRLHEQVLARVASRTHWDYTSTVGTVVAAIAGLLFGLDQARLAHAIALAASHQYTIGQVRSGRVSMSKAVAGAAVAASALVDVLLARSGMAGPRDALEGTDGVFAALGLEATADAHDALVAPIDLWHIQEVSIKCYPAIGTAQGVIAATLELVAEHGLSPGDIAAMVVAQPDLPSVRLHQGDLRRSWPVSRDAADHSIPFLVAVAVEDGQVSPAQYEENRWDRRSTRELMGKVLQVTDPALNSSARRCVPAVVTIETTRGASVRREVRDVPGSPANPFSDEALRAKVHRLGGRYLYAGQAEAIGDASLSLVSAPDVSALVAALHRSEMCPSTGS